jgi:hypothetical protein
VLICLEERLFFTRRGGSGEEKNKEDFTDLVFPNFVAIYFQLDHLINFSKRLTN